MNQQDIGKGEYFLNPPASGNVGIGTLTPSAALHITTMDVKMGLFTLTSGMEGNARLTSPGSSLLIIDGFLGTNIDDYALPFITNNEERMRIEANGNVGIGTSAPQAKLSVNGDIFSRKVKVIQTGWPDYVFNDSYRLPSLAEIEDFIQQHRHLQEIPSANEIDRKGLDVGDMQAALLKKVEELTLYIIQQEKRIGELEGKLGL